LALALSALSFALALAAALSLVLAPSALSFALALAAALSLVLAFAVVVAIFL
jgi:hypothetical protein